MPGSDRLARELGVGRNTLDAALLLLEKEGLLLSQGVGRRRRIQPAAAQAARASLKVQLLLYEASDRKIDYLLELIYQLREAGHDAAFADKSMLELGMNASRVARFVASTEADAWIVASGSREVLEWFSNQPTPAFALFGRLTSVDMASTSPRAADAIAELVQRLVDWGHRRIVYLVREERRKPTPGFLENYFLEQLKSHGIAAGAYNLPDWEDSPEGVQQLLIDDYKVSPPTAYLISGPQLFTAVRNLLADRGILAPRQVSLICTDPDLTFEWCLPQVSHITWDAKPLLRRVVHWVNNISRGKEDRRKTSHKARLVIGGTMGPAP